MTDNSNNYVPQYLGVKSTGPIDRVDLIPWQGRAVDITLQCDEFTSLCPVTNQPDFGTITITYRPQEHLIETKSLKLYLLRYRNTGVFSEALVDQIANDLVQQVHPQWIEVTGEFESRGGIGIRVTARRPEGTE